MPLIQITTNKSISDKAQTASRISAFVSGLLNKSEAYVLVNIIQNQDMLFGGTKDDLAYVELKSIELPKDKTSHFSKELCSFLNQLFHINQSRIYIEFTNAEGGMWGWNGKTFER